MAGFDNLSNSFGTGIQAGQMASGQGRFGSVNEGLQNLLQLMLAKKQRDDRFAQAQQMQQAGFGQENALQQMRGQQDTALQNLKSQQGQAELQQRLAALKEIANIRAQATTQAATTRAKQQKRQGVVKMMTAGAPTPYQLAETQGKVPFYDFGMGWTPQGQAYKSLQSAAQTQGNIKQSLLNSAGEGTTQEPNVDDLHQRYLQDIQYDHLLNQNQ